MGDGDELSTDIKTNTDREDVSMQTDIQLEKNITIAKCPGRAVRDFIISNHYSHKIAPISYAWAMQNTDGDIIGAVTFGQPASPYVSISIRGKDNTIPVIELNRLAIKSNDKNAASKLIGYALRNLPKNILVVSYADCGVGHIGYVYQATNWHYAGISKARTDIFSETGHSRHHCGDTSQRQPRSAKHRYWISTGRKANRASMWDSLPYPKGETNRH
jgi:hypothetical protein